MLLLLLCSLAFANEAVVTLEAGEPAPFKGTLLSPEAAAKIIVDTDYSIEKCKINAERDLALQEAKADLKFKNKEAEFAACTLRSAEMEKLYEEHITFLERQAVRPQWETPVYFAAGVLAGVAVFYGSSLVVKNLQ